MESALITFLLLLVVFGIGVLVLVYIRVPRLPGHNVVINRVDTAARQLYEYRHLVYRYAGSLMEQEASMVDPAILSSYRTRLQTQHQGATGSVEAATTALAGYGQVRHEREFFAAASTMLAQVNQAVAHTKSCVDELRRLEPLFDQARALTRLQAQIRRAHWRGLDDKTASSLYAQLDNALRQADQLLADGRALSLNEYAPRTILKSLCRVVAESVSGYDQALSLLAARRYDDYNVASLDNDRVGGMNKGDYLTIIYEELPVRTAIDITDLYHYRWRSRRR